jgi:hypothetical protein
VYVRGRREGKAYGRHDSRDQTSPPAEHREEPNHKLHRAQHRCNGKTPHHEPGNLLIRVQALLHLVPRGLLQTRVLELPYRERIEPELGAGLGAKGNRLRAGGLVLGAGAIRPETDLVEVLELAGRRVGLQGLEQVVVDVDVVEDGFGGGGEGRGIGLSLRISIVFEEERVGW